MDKIVSFPNGMKAAFARDGDVCVIYYNSKTGKITRTEGIPLKEVRAGRDANTAFATLLTASWRDMGRSNW